MLKKIMCTAMASMIYSTSGLALSIDVKDYDYQEDEGLFFLRSNIEEKIVYYIPQTVQTIRATGVTSTIDGEEYKVYEAAVAFPAEVDFDKVKARKSGWRDAAFLRTDVEAVSDCKVSLPSTSRLTYFQKISDEWQRRGLVSSSEAFLCKVNIAIKPNDQRTLSKLQQLAADNKLIDRGLAKFQLTSAAAASTIALEPIYDFLVAASDARDSDQNLTKTTAVLLLGASLSTMNDERFQSLLPDLDTELIGELLAELFDVTNGRYELKESLESSQLKYGVSVTKEVEL